jgi:hypothetical protein
MPWIGVLVPPPSTMYLYQDTQLTQQLPTETSVGNSVFRGCLSALCLCPVSFLCIASSIFRCPVPIGSAQHTGGPLAITQSATAIAISTGGPSILAVDLGASQAECALGLGAIHADSALTLRT